MGTVDTPRRSGSNGTAFLVEPDLEFIQALTRQAGPGFRKCFQCGTCSSTCELSPESRPFPRKEMAWAVWGLKDKLVADPDAWLCHQCNDCTTECPRGGRPGDVLAAVRHETVIHHAAPRFLARWVGDPVYLPLMLAIPAVLLSLALLATEPLGRALGFEPEAGERIVFSYSRLMPQWLLNGFFGLTVLLAALASVVSAMRFWRAMKAADPGGGVPRKGRAASFAAAIVRAFSHREFEKCGTARARQLSHRLVFFGFLGLTLVTLWVITAPVNPLIRDGFVYPFPFWSPFKVLANLSGIAVLVGLVLMVRDRVRAGTPGGRGSYRDWALLATIALVVLSGFLTEVLHYVRLQPHRHAVYFAHLVFVFMLLFYLPYSKLAHLVYRLTAFAYAERTGRDEGGKEAAHD